MVTCVYINSRLVFAFRLKVMLDISHA